MLAQILAHSYKRVPRPIWTMTHEQVREVEQGLAAIGAVRRSGGRWELKAPEGRVVLEVSRKGVMGWLHPSRVTSGEMEALDRIEQDIERTEALLARVDEFLAE